MLNQVHWLHRQAEKATRKGHIQEAIDKHREAVGEFFFFCLTKSH